MVVKHFDGVPQHHKTFTKHFGYGTAGFRAHADDPPMDSIFFRMGVLAGLRSKHFDGHAMGIMVTASHNPPQDNGIKIVDTEGHCINDPSFEKLCEEFANAEEHEFGALVESVSKKGGTLEPKGDSMGLVIVGRDTRVSSERLSKCIIRGAVKVGAHFEDYGIIHTPLVHHIVRMINGHDSLAWASQSGYYDMLEHGFRDLCATGPVISRKSGKDTRHRVLVDAACGVGGLILPGVLERMGDVMCCHTQNKPSKPTTLNVGCGAEFVHKSHKAPMNYDTKSKVPFCCSFDGDADRLIFHYFDKKKRWHMLDGDKITSLLTDFVQTCIKESGVSGISFAAIQNSYANGASTAFLRDKGVEVVLCKTGVKYMEHAAKNYDVSCLFESNGHGTVLINDKVREKMSEPSSNAKEQTARSRMLALRKVCNQAVGDAISMLFAVVGVLGVQGMTVEDWDALYADLPCVQAKVAVPDRTKAVPNDSETRLTEPQALQEKIDVLVKKYPSGRSFVRPSGTEDIIRVYAEAATAEDAQQLADAVQKAVVEQFAEPAYDAAAPARRRLSAPTDSA